MGKALQFSLLLVCAFLAGWLGRIMFTTKNVHPITPIVVDNFHAQPANNIIARNINPRPLNQLHRPPVPQQSKQTLLKIELIDALGSQDLDLFLNLLKRIENPQSDKYKMVRYQFLQHVLALDSASTSIPFIQRYLNIETYSPSALVLTAILQKYQGQHFKSIAGLYTLKSYYQEEVKLSVIDELIQHATETYTRQLRQEKQWNKLLGFYDFLFRQEGERPQYHYAKAQIYTELQQYNNALASLQLLNSLPEWHARAQQLKLNIVATFENTAAQVALLKIGEHYCVDILVNNQSIRFLIDTGASLSTIDPTIARAQLNLTTTDQKISINTANGTVQTRLLMANTFGIPGFLHRNVMLAEVPLPPKMLVHGLLGMDYLKHYEFYIDQQKNRLYLDGIPKL